MRADLERLAEGEPVLAGKAALGAGHPQDQDIDAAVSAAGRGVLRQAERGGGAGPWLDPGHVALFELGDDFVGDFLVEAGAVGKGFVGWGRMGHGRSPRRAGESLSLACDARHRSSPLLFLSLSGVPLRAYAAQDNRRVDPQRPRQLG